MIPSSAARSALASSSGSLPDFTIEDQAMGRTILWEHCGMLADEGYKERWQTKLQ